MINLTPGITNSVWLSLKEMLPSGLTQSPSYKLELTREINGAVTTLTPTDLSTQSSWSNFAINLNLEPGNYSYKVTETNTNTTLEIGRAIVTESPKVYPVRPDVPKKDNVRVYKK